MMLLVKSIMMGFLFPIFVFDLSAGPFHRVGAATGRQPKPPTEKRCGRYEAERAPTGAPAVLRGGATAVPCFAGLYAPNRRRFMPALSSAAPSAIYSTALASGWMSPMGTE